MKFTQSLLPTKENQKQKINSKNWGCSCGQPHFFFFVVTGYGYAVPRARWSPWCRGEGSGAGCWHQARPRWVSLNLWIALGIFELYLFLCENYRIGLKSIDIKETKYFCVVQNNDCLPIKRVFGSRNDGAIVKKTVIHANLPVKISTFVV